MPHSPIFAPGQQIPHHGIYLATHGSKCPLSSQKKHLVTGTQGIDFPLCHQCGAEVRFTVTKTYEINKDPANTEATPMHKDAAFEFKYP